ncbi:MAG TPA: HlyD family efflux transporter periplasmic adaptor subunit [Bacteroidales bacterium]|nr:HlyD family efflux transporter periplasmic adaptor subunit [Bacteroidales bacterium]HPR12915.1 HlyD family efflux transporter periplasmic adaptor subunit [Bacteroidales bacterium]
MKRTVLITIAVVVGATIVLLIINRIFSKKDDLNIFAEATEGIFEITVSNAGELLAENSTDIYGPQLVESSEEQQGGNQQRGGGQRGGGGGGGRSGGMGGGSHGGDFHMMDFKITDIVAEGTIVKKGDYVAQLDRTNYQNTLTDARESLKTLQENLELKILDTAMSLTSLRDEIKNQRYAVEEAAIDLEQSKYEPPAVKRKAETKLNTQQRALEQLLQSYNLRKTQIATDIRSQKLALEDQELLVQNLENFLAQFTVRAPSDGMIIYKKDRLGNKRKAGSSINPFDNVIATLPDLNSMLSKMYVSEIEVNKINLGLKVHITVDALADKSYTGTVISVANVGEQLPNSNSKMFEVIIKVDGFDPVLRPAMTTWNKIVLKTIPMAVYVPLDCVHTGSDSITYVYKKNKTKQIVVLGEFNDKHVIIKEGLEPGTPVFTIEPEDAEEFRVTGKDLITLSKGS